MASRFWQGQALAALGIVVSAVPARAGEPSSCKAPRFADIGWSDITATTALDGASAVPALSKGLGL